MALTRKTVKWTVLITLIIIALIYALLSAGDLFKGMLFEKVLAETAENLNKKCPKRIDKASRLDSVYKVAHSTLSYYFTLTTVDTSMIDRAVFTKEETKRLAQEFKTNAELKYFRDNKATVIYNYADKNHAPICRIAVTPELYR